jgi:hypothetical protein
MTYWSDAATKIASVTTQAYVDGLNAIVDYQEVARQASQAWFAEVTSAQSKVTGQVAKSSDVIVGKLTDVAKETAQQAGQSGTEVAKRTRDAATKAARATQTQTPQAKTPARTKSAPESTPQPEPGRWTQEAYEALTAVEINEKLPQFSQRELREVKIYEQAHQSRQTVLDKIGSLEGQEPVLGYDELTVPEVQKQLTDGDEKLAAKVRDYERPHKNREGVLHAVDAKLNQS